MKKNLITLAIFGTLSGTTLAQSSITMYGSFDAGLRSLTNAGPANAATSGTKLTMGSGGTYNSNRLGFKGVEDLGGGLTARFTLESGFNSGTGAMNNTLGQLFDRVAAVGVTSDWGALDFGRQYSVSYKVVAAHDPLNFKFTPLAPVTAWPAGSQGTSVNPLGYGSIRLNNDIQYSKVLGPVTAYAEYAAGEAVGNSANGRTLAAGAIYRSGPLSLGGAYTLRKTDGVFHPAGTPFANTINLATTSATPFDKSNVQWTIAGAYRIGGTRLAGGYLNEKQDLRTGGEFQTRNYWAGISYYVTPLTEITGAYFQTEAEAPGFEGTRRFFILSGTYALSKRTVLYADIDCNQYQKGAIGFFAPRGVEHQRGISLGINHFF